MKKSTPQFVNRELSWLEFNQRVLDEAADEQIPLLERLKFLAITASNLDEFFMVRVGGLQMLAKQARKPLDLAGMTPEEQLQAISERTHKMTKDQYSCYLNDIEPALENHGIRRVHCDALTEWQFQWLEQMFESEIHAVLAPLAVSSADDFPTLANQSLTICVQLKPATGADAAESDKPRFALIPLGRTLSRFITLASEGGYEYIPLEDVVKLFIERFFHGEEIIEAVPFRITRNADLSMREDLAADLMSVMEDVIDARKIGDCARLEISADATPCLLDFLKETLEVSDQDIYSLPGPLDLSAFMSLTSLPGYDDLNYPSWPACPSPLVAPDESMFKVISQHDVLLYHPYESFEPVVRLIDEAADDPDVLAIKQTLYRTSRNSPIVAALIRAAEQGKHVTVIVELKARFDEERNIGWAKHLESAGVQVFYGVKGLKTHAKICIIVRREPHGIVRYMHFGTGNYNEATARIYGDISYMSCDEDLGIDATNFFNAITGYSQPQRFRKIEAAPISLRDRILELIEGESKRAEKGQKALIIAKLNSLADPILIKALYKASQNGVKIELNIRGICCLCPGVPGLSENISVVSIIDRYLEHARILYFYHSGDERVFISSADWMPRNLDRRVELLTPVEDTASRNKLIHYLKLHKNDNVKGRVLLADGGYKSPKRKKNAKRHRSQEELFEEFRDQRKKLEKTKRTVFEPHQAPDAVK